MIAGHGLTVTTVELGTSDIPTVRVNKFSPAQLRTYVVAATGWPCAKLKTLLRKAEERSVETTW